MTRHTRLVTIQDVSCFGKCSLTVALPIISAMGVETCIIPTAVLSTHTAFEGFTFRDLTDDIPAIAEHWKMLALSFDAIYTGYLGSVRQIDMMKRFFADFGTQALKIVDPVMADNGKLYPGFTPAFAAEMATLCGCADLIVPNLTEACFLLGEEYDPGISRDEVRAKELLRRLCALGCRTAVLTGYFPDEAHQGALSYDSHADAFTQYVREHLDVKFHGTGDVFSSTLAGALTLGRPMEDALRAAVNFTVDSIRATMDDRDTHWYGVRFEDCIPALLRELEAR